MHVVTFSCPHCSVPLRVRDRSFLHRTIACPDCGNAVRIVEAEGGQLAGLADEPEAVPIRSRRLAHRLSPTAVAWIVAGLLSLSFVVFLLFPRSSSTNEKRDVVANEREALPENEQDLLELVVPANEAPRTERRLLGLHQQIAPLLEHNGRFPTGTVSTEETPIPERLSWLATIAASADPDGPQPRWDRPWNDPVNDRFVRRQLTHFLNPAVDKLVGADRYPATHFVGVAGVGDDAAMLAADHPRAGIFGTDRKVSIADVRDGLAHTMLVAGVEMKLGSWAAGGEATVRGFTAEPYLRGPDGFGTGQAEGMHVLMADGSVRFLSQNTAPTIIRRLAAMNDGLPLDADVPGEPGDRSEPRAPLIAGNDVPAGPPPPAAEVTDGEGEMREADRVIAELAHPRDVPIEVPMAEPVPVYDTDEALRQTILAFDQADPVPVRDLLRLVEEMAAVPIHFDKLTPELAGRLAEPITVSLKETTVGGILEAILQKADLSFEPRPEGIFIQAPRGSAAAFQ